MKFPDLKFSGMFTNERLKSVNRSTMQMTTVQDYLQGVVKQAKERSGSQSGFNSRNSRNTDEGKNKS